MSMLTSIIGGIGLFLLGMFLLTDSLKSIAGDALKNLLSRFTGGIFSSILSGATMTAIIQSSSATTLMTIGFVSAGLLTFSQSIGVIIGANVGSTSTGWIVSLIGFKIDLNAFSLPLIGIGIFIRMVGKGKYSAYGMSIVGFGLLFLGINVMQEAMAGVADTFDISRFSGDSFFHLFILIIVGIVMTVIMQSSSAAVVTTLAALNTGAIGFEQAAALVIGQNIGTTVKAVLASIGASIPAKRTSVIHILFNVLTGVIAIILLPVLLSFIFYISVRLSIGDAAVLLAIFHTMFNVIGVIIFLPFIKPISTFVTRIIPQKESHLTRHLDESVASVSSVALEAVRRTLIEIIKVLVSIIEEIVRNGVMTEKGIKSRLQVELAIKKVRQFLSMVDLQNVASSQYKNHVSLLHVIDHLERLIKLTKTMEFQGEIVGHADLKKANMHIKKIISSISNQLDYSNNISGLLEEVEKNSLALAEIRRLDRQNILGNTLREEQTSIDSAILKVHVLLWIDGVGYHFWRAIYHLEQVSE